MSRQHVLAVLAVLLGCGVAAAAEAASVSGTVASFGRQRVAGAEVTLTAFPDKACADLADKKDRSQAETERLTKCRKQNVRTTKTGRDGMFEFRELPAGWYSITIRWAEGSSPIFLRRESVGEYRVRTYQDDNGKYGFWAESAAFELKAADAHRKDLTGM